MQIFTRTLVRPPSDRRRQRSARAPTKRATRSPFDAALGSAPRAIDAAAASAALEPRPSERRGRRLVERL
eukprot:342939-Alexandrium_andersonii.AAC.1